MTDPNELVRAMTILRGVPREELALVPTERVEREAGEPFFAQGDPGHSAYGIVTGRVRIMKQGSAGRDLCLDVLGPGELVAAVAVVRRKPMPASAFAVERTLCLQVPAAAFRALLERHPSAAAKMLDMVSRRLLDAGDARLELATEEVETRLARALLRLAIRYGADRGGEIVFSQNLTRQNLADLAGTTVESTIRVMSRWTKQDLIRSAQQRITIQDPDGLRRLCGSACTEGSDDEG